MGRSKSKTRFYIYSIALLPFIILLGTGVVMLNYHTGTPIESVILGLNGHDWLLFHKVMCVIITPLILFHLFVKTDWVKRLFTFNVKGKYKVSNILLFVIFSACSITAIFSWLFFSGTDISGILKGIHNKLGILLIIVFVIHLINYSKTMISAAKQIINK